MQQVEVGVPSPSKGEVLLKLEATTLNPIDWKIQKGLFRPLMPKRFPYIPGNLSHFIDNCDLYVFVSMIVFILVLWKQLPMWLEKLWRLASE